MGAAARNRPHTAVRRIAGGGRGRKFFEALDDDLNISGALGAFVRIDSRNESRDGSANRFGSRERPGCIGGNESTACSALDAAEKARRPRRSQPGGGDGNSRLAKDWQKSDELREELNARGWKVRDTKDGQKITRRAGGSGDLTKKRALPISSLSSTRPTPNCSKIRITS